MSEINVTTIKNENADYGPNLVGYSTVTGDLNVTGTITGDGSGLTGLGNTANIKSDTISNSGIITSTGFVGPLTGNLTGDVTGNITGNVTGNVTGDLTGDVIGTATTATTATNVTVADESTDTSCNVLFVTSTTGNLPLKSGTNLTFNSSTAELSTTTFNGSLSGTATNATNITLADDSSDTTSFPIFATDATGNQSVKTDSSALTYNASDGTLSATNINSTSDESLKKDINTIVDGLEIINSIDGVRFVWKESNKPSVGVIAQDVEKVLPELISERTDTGTKSVNYNGLVGVLIEAVKELSSRVEVLENNK